VTRRVSISDVCSPHIHTSYESHIDTSCARDLARLRIQCDVKSQSYSVRISSPPADSDRSRDEALQRARGESGSCSSAALCRQTFGELVSRCPARSSAGATPLEEPDAPRREADPEGEGVFAGPLAHADRWHASGSFSPLVDVAGELHCQVTSSGEAHENREDDVRRECSVSQPRVVSPDRTRARSTRCRRLRMDSPPRISPGRSGVARDCRCIRRSITGGTP
jgi:hypothetical protein